MSFFEKNNDPLSPAGTLPKSDHKPTDQKPDQKTSERKQEHLDICKKENVQSLSSTGFDDIQLPHFAIPDIDFSEISLRTQFLGNEFSAPLLISSMTGGSAEGEKINQTLARFAERSNIPMGVGSSRVAIENRDPKFFEIRKIAPRAQLWANIGIVQLNYGVSGDDLKWVIENLEASALILHTNPLQEAIQKEGDRNFSELFQKIESLKKVIQVPLVLKETGCGLDASTAKRAMDAGIDALDVAGRGGSHWGYIEGLRAPNRKALGEMFRDWGTSTVESLVTLREELGPHVPLIASGGIRNGLDIAKSLFLGADFAGMALEFLKQASLGDTALDEFFELQCEALRIAMFCSSALNIAELKYDV